MDWSYRYSDLHFAVSAFRSDNIVVIEGIAALRAELGNLGTLLGLVTTLVASVLGSSRRLLAATLGTEFTLVHSTAAAGPAVGIGRLLGTALGAELTGCSCTAGAGPFTCSDRC